MQTNLENCSAALSITSPHKARPLRALIIYKPNLVVWHIDTRRHSQAEITQIAAHRRYLVGDIAVLEIDTQPKSN